MSALLRVAVALHLLAISNGGWAAERSSFSVVLEGGRLSVVARGATRHEVVEEISRQGSFRVRTEPALAARLAQEPVSASFSHLSIEEALRRLLGSENLVFIHSQAALDEVHVYAAASRPAGPVQKPAAASGEIREPAAPPTKKLATPWSALEGRPGPAVQKSVIAEPVAAVIAERDPGWWRDAALGNPDPSLRATAVEELAGTGDERLARDTAVAMLEKENDQGVRESALRVLLDLESTPVDLIARFVAAEGEPEPVRVRALALLAERGSGDSRVLALLERLARSDAHEDVRESATALLQDLRQE